MGGGAPLLHGKFNGAMSKVLSAKVSRESVATLKRKLDAISAELEVMQTERTQVENTYIHLRNHLLNRS